MWFVSTFNPIAHGWNIGCSRALACTYACVLTHACARTHTHRLGGILTYYKVSSRWKININDDDNFIYHLFNRTQGWSLDGIHGMDTPVIKYHMFPFDFKNSHCFISPLTTTSSSINKQLLLWFVGVLINILMLTFS